MILIVFLRILHVYTWIITTDLITMLVFTLSQICTSEVGKCKVDHSHFKCVPCFDNFSSTVFICVLSLDFWSIRERQGNRKVFKSFLKTATHFYCQQHNRGKPCWKTNTKAFCFLLWKNLSAGPMFSYCHNIWKEEFMSK